MYILTYLKEDIHLQLERKENENKKLSNRKIYLF